MEKNNIYYQQQIDKILCFLKDEVEPYETLKEIPDTDSKYFVSNRGRIVSLCRNEAHVLKPALDDGGYWYVHLMIDGKQRMKRIHALVAKAFMEQPEGTEVHHIDGNKDNNDISNLVFLTKEQHTKAHRLLKRQDTDRKQV